EPDGLEMAAAIEEVELLGFIIGGAVAHGAVIDRAEAGLDGLGQGGLGRSNDDGAGRQPRDILRQSGRCARGAEEGGDQADHELVHLSSMHGNASGAPPPRHAPESTGGSAPKLNTLQTLTGAIARKVVSGICGVYATFSEPPALV